jgi:hypothetical protein
MVLIVTSYKKTYIEHYKKKSSFRDPERERELQNILRNYPGSDYGSFGQLVRDIFGTVKLLSLSFKDSFVLVDTLVALPDELQRAPKPHEIPGTPDITNVFT